MKGPAIERTLFGAVVILILSYMTAGVMMAIQGFEEGWLGSQIAGPLGTFGAVIFLAGLYLARRSPMTGAALVVGGAVLMGYVMYWSVVAPAVAVLMAVFGVRRALKYVSARRAAAH